MPSIKTRPDDEHSKLANLLANREDGIDTFGNWGNLRCVSVCIFTLLRAVADPRGCT